MRLVILQSTMPRLKVIESQLKVCRAGPHRKPDKTALQDQRLSAKFLQMGSVTASSEWDRCFGRGLPRLSYGRPAVPYSASAD